MTVAASIFNRHRVAFGIALAVVLLAAAIPITAYVIVPQFVRSTLVESPPGGAPRSAGTSTVAGAGQAAGGSSTGVNTRTIATGDLRRINLVDYGTGRVLVLQVGFGRFLRFDNVEIGAAPAQHIYLSDQTDGSPGSFTDLGPLKATRGSFNYDIPASVDITRVRSVVSWCLQFQTTVTYAVLQAP